MPKPRSPSAKDRERPGRGKGRYIPKRKVCSFCAGRVETIDYKDVPLLRRYISDRGRIEPRRRTGVCARHQRALCIALKRARHIALLPYTSEHIRQIVAPSPK
jgi:small subunit ribosomal protein S18